MSKTLIAYFSRADENYFGGAMRYIKVGNTEIAVGKIRELIDADTFKIAMRQKRIFAPRRGRRWSPCRILSTRTTP